MYFDTIDEYSSDPWDRESSIARYKDYKRSLRGNFAGGQVSKKDKKRRYNRSAKKRAKKLINALKETAFPLTNEGYERLRDAIKSIKSGRMD